jgi:hypothetical protein
MAMVMATVMAMVMAMVMAALANGVGLLHDDHTDAFFADL